MSSETEHVRRDLRAVGLRCTAPRVAVLTELRAAPGHWRVDELAAAVRDRLGRVSTQAVYDVLAALEHAGLARRVQPAGGAARFEARTTGHDHAVCRSCGAITDLEPAPRSSRRWPDVGDGFVAETVELTVWGRCAACVAEPFDAISDPTPDPDHVNDPSTDAEEAQP